MASIELAILAQRLFETEQLEAVVFAIIALTAYVTYKGLRDQSFFDQYSFQVEAIAVRKDYKRLYTSGLLHGSWLHFGVNMYALYSFAVGFEYIPVLYGFHLGVAIALFLGVYVASLIGGSLFAWYVHRAHPDYSAIGASGAVSGIIFACVILDPDVSLLLFFAIPCPGWLFAILFMAYTIYGIKTKRDNIGHEAHLGGAAVGLIIGLICFPSMLVDNTLGVGLTLVPLVVFGYVLLKRPDILWRKNVLKKASVGLTQDQAYNQNRARKQRELDRLLDKVSKKGVEGLSRKEKERLDELSGR